MASGIWYSNQSYPGIKICKAVKILENGEEEIVGVSDTNNSYHLGRLPASYLIPQDDPQYNRDGSSALGVHGYMLNSRCWVYDAGLALLVFTHARDYDLCREMQGRLQTEQNSDGSFNFSYDLYIGQLFQGYVRTGAIGWLVWGMCYYALETGDLTYKPMIEKAGQWLLSRQVTEKGDPRYGLLTGGHGAYGDDYSYQDIEIEWCSVEHQCSSLQALTGCSLVLGNTRYKEATELIRDQLCLKCYDRENGRFYQGINGGRPDVAWALDCTTWAGMLITSVIHSDCARTCLATAKEVYLTEDKAIVQSSVKEHYNQAYSSESTFSGFKPYSDRTEDYAGAPDLVWTEETLGYAALALMLGDVEEAAFYVDECIRLQNCDGCTGGLIYTTAAYGSLPWEFHVWESVVSSAWLYLLIHCPEVLFPRTLRQVYYMAKITNIQDERPEGPAVSS